MGISQLSNIQDYKERKNIGDCPGQCGSLVEHWPSDLRVLDSNPGQGRVCGLHIQSLVWWAWETTNRCVSLELMFLSYSLPSSPFHSLIINGKKYPLGSINKTEKGYRRLNIYMRSSSFIQNSEILNFHISCINSPKPWGLKSEFYQSIDYKLF